MKRSHVRPSVWTGSPSRTDGVINLDSSSGLLFIAHYHRLFYYYFLLSPSNEFQRSAIVTHCMERAWATIVSHAVYLPGALVLAYCLEVVKSRYPLVALGRPSLSQQTRTLLARVGIPYVGRTGLYPSREQQDPQNADARGCHLNEGLCRVREHLGWFRVKGPMLFLWAGESKRMWMACTT